MQFQKAEFDDILAREDSRIILYFINEQDRRGVRVDLGSGEIGYRPTPIGERFLCLIESPDGKLRVSACLSTTGKYDALNLKIESQALFDDNVLPSEIDHSKALRDGHNVFLYDVYVPFVALDFREPFLETQKIGSDDFVAQCSSLHFTSRDGFGSVGLYQTTVRPHFRGTLGYGNGEDDGRTASAEAVHLKASRFEGYRCEEAVTLASGLVFIVSESTLIALDYKNKRFGVARLPVSPSGPVLIRSIGQ